MRAKYAGILNRWKASTAGLEEFFVVTQNEQLLNRRKPTGFMVAVLGSQTEQATSYCGVGQELVGDLARSVLQGSPSGASSAFAGSSYGASDFLERRRRSTA